MLNNHFHFPDDFKFFVAFRFQIRFWGNMVFKFNIVYDVVYCEVQEELVSFPCELLFNNIRHGECVNKKLSKSDLSSTNFMAS